MAEDVIESVVSRAERIPPPDRIKVRYDWERIADSLREYPGEWLRIFTDGRTSTKNAVVQGAIRAVRPALGFEVRTTDNTRGSPRTCTMWMRWNPDKVDPVALAAWESRKNKREVQV